MTLNGSPYGNEIDLEGIRNATAVTVNAGAGNDTIQMFHRAATFAGALTIDGQGGVNTLDYSNFTGDATVDLPSGTATAISGGVSNIQDVIGSQGNDILVGNGGNVLTGGTGRNLLIAGPTASTLVGNSGEDILVGGTTGYENNPPALAALRAEWTRTDLPYSARVHHLLHGGGLNGATLLDQAAFTPNAGGNTLTGAAGLDLFYGSLALDKYDWEPTIGEIFIEKGQLHASTQLDIGALTHPYLTLDGKLISPSSSQQLTLAPGSHTLSEYATGGSVTFTVADDGTVSYDQKLDQAGILSGQGTNHLVANGALVTINAQALSNPILVLDNYTVKQPGTFPARLLPGSHLLHEYTAGTISFTVGNDGSVGVSDPNLLSARIVSVQGSQLTVNGVAVTINAQALSDPYLAVDNYTPEKPGTFQVNLLPGNHVLQAYTAGSISFTVGDNGSIGVSDPKLVSAEIVSVYGGQLYVNGVAVTIHAQALSDPYLAVDNYTPEKPGTFQVNLLPGNHLMQESGGGNISFTVANDSSISFSDTNLVSAGIVSVNGNQLVVNGAHVAIDARALGNTTVYLDYYTAKQTGSVIFVNLLPGTHHLQIYSGVNLNMYQFTVTPQGDLAFDSSEDNVFALQGLQTLVVSALA